MASSQPSRRALVVYGSETGNAQDVAEEMGRFAERLRFDTEVAQLNSIGLKQLLQHDVVLISISTTGQGELPANSQTFWKALRSARLRPGCLQQMRFASFGLGDSSYPKFNWAHRKLYNRLVQLGAQRVCDRGESDEQHPEGQVLHSMFNFLQIESFLSKYSTNIYRSIAYSPSQSIYSPFYTDGSFLPWSTNLRKRLLEEYPLPEGVEPIPDNVLLKPKWFLDLAEDTTDGSSGKRPPSIELGASVPVTNGCTLDVPPPDLLAIPNSLVTQITSNERITPKTHWQDVRHLKLETVGSHPYVPGDVLIIYPKNFPSDVTNFLTLMNWTSIADSPLRFTPSSPSTTSSTTLPIPSLSHHSTITLRELLTKYLDIISIPRRSFFAQLAHYTSDSFHRDRLLEFTNPEYIDELYDYTTRPRRSILEVLQEFESVKIPWQRICSIIPVIRGRQFSIASAMNPNIEIEGKTRIELLVAIVKYKTVIKRIRQGVATRYIASLKAGQEITISLSKGGLGVSAKEVDRPVVMVGPGTGVAPMRALIYQRMQWRREFNIESEGMVKDLLFFGCRNSEADYFFRDEWETLECSGAPLEVFTAFSRDQRQKIYVQDLLRQHSMLVFDSLITQNGIIFICGSSGKMPQAVREALIEVFQKHGDIERDDAEQTLVTMEKSGRYRQETW